MSDVDQPSKTRASDESKSSLSELLRVGADSNAMLLGPTPGENEDGASSTEEGAAEKAETKDGATAAAGEATPAEPASEEADETPARAGRPSSARGRAAGLLITVAGAVLLAIPLLSASLAQEIGRFLDPRALAPVLIVGGLWLTSSSALRRNLQVVQDSLDDMSRETARLSKIGKDSRAVLDALHTVRLENTTLAEDVVKLAAKIKRLTDIVSNPDYAGSIFRLAASVDSLGKHVEIYMKEQFGALQQRLSAVAQQSEHAEHQLKTALGQVHALTKEQLRVQQLAVQEGFGHLHTSSDKSVARIEQALQVTARIEASLQSQQEALANGWTSLSDRLALSVSQVAADLNHLRSSVDRQVETQSASLRVEFEGIDDHIAQAERSQASGIQQLAEKIQGQLASRIDELQQNLKALSELSTRSNKAVADEFGMLGVRLEKQTKEQQASLQQGVKTLAELSALGQKAVAGEFGELGARFDKQSKEQQASLQQVRERATEATRAAKGELAAILEQLRSHVEQLAREQTAAVHKSSQDVQQAAGAAQSELSVSLEQIGSRLEKALEAQKRNLASDMMEVAEMVQSVTTEVRSCIAESIVRLVSATAESAASTSAAPDWPRIEVPNTEPAPTDGWPHSEPIDLAAEPAGDLAAEPAGDLATEPQSAEGSSPEIEPPAVEDGSASGPEAPTP